MGWETDLPVDESIKRLPSGQYQVSAEPVSVTAKRATPQEIAAEQASLATTPYSGGAEATRALIGQGLGMGFGEEIEAGVRAPFSDETYKQIRDRLRAQQEQFGKDYPVTQTGLELVGGLALPVGGLMAGGKVAGSLLGAGKTAIGTAAKGAGVGAASGAITGAGTAKELENIPMDMTAGAVVGGGLGAVVPSAVNLTGKAIKNVIDAAGFSNANKVASSKIAEILQKENLSPDDAKSILAEYRRLGVPDPVLADLGENLRGLGYAANIVPSTEKTATAKFLEDRQSELAQRLITGLEQKSGVQSQGKFGFDYINELTDAQNKAARSAYPKAYRLDLPATPFRKFVDRPVFQQAYENAVKRNELFKGDEGFVQLPALEQIRNAQFINTNILHEIKKGLDSVIEKETDTITGKMTGYGSDVAKVKREFNDLIKYYNKDYANANAKFADSISLQNAYKDGLDYMKMESSELVSKLKKMKPADKEAFRVGMLSDIRNKYSTFKGKDATGLVFKSPRQKESLRYAFDSKAQFDDFVDQVKAQEELLKTYQKVRGGSQTQERAMLTEDAGMAMDVLPQVATGNITGAAMNLARRGAARAGGISPESAAIIQQKLFNPSPAGQNKMLDLLNEQIKKQSQRNPLQQTGTYSFGLGELQGLLGQ